MDPIALLKDLIALPSVNPMGRDISGPEFLEGRMADYIEAFFQRLGVTYRRMEVLPGRDNIVARIDGAGPTIVLDAHIDTVPIDGMTIEPFTPTVREGRVYGRGACDDKGGLAAMLTAFARLAEDRPAGMANVVMSCTCDEEQLASGAVHLTKTWSDPATRKPLFSGPPDVVVAAEPTNLDIVVAHRGAVRWKLRTTGKACHSSRPHEGVNAVYKMANVLTCLERYADELPRMVPAHPLCGTATFSVGVITGGISVNTVPDECLIEIDRRVLPGEDPSTVIPHVTRYLRERLDVDFEMLPPWITGATLSDANNSDWANRLMRHITAVVGPRQKIGVPYGTNASRFSAYGVPAIVFGPGSIDQAHTKDEWVPIDEVQQATEIFYKFCTKPL